MQTTASTDFSGYAMYLFVHTQRILLQREHSDKTYFALDLLPEKYFEISDSDSPRHTLDTSKQAETFARDKGKFPPLTCIFVLQIYMKNMVVLIWTSTTNSRQHPTSSYYKVS